MTLEVIVPCLRNPAPLIESLGYGTRLPDLVTLVSNEVSADWVGVKFPMRILRFKSDTYCYGEMDVVLRRNIGAYWSTADHIVFQDDDQVAPSNMLEESEKLLEAKTFFAGNYRYIDFAGHSTFALAHMPPAAGRSRENPPNFSHLYYSCYGGMIGVQRKEFLRLGGFDMAFLGRHGAEDQQFGFRYSGQRVFVYDPPFTWHPEPRVANWDNNTPHTNSCRDHEFVTGDGIKQCQKCPFRVHVGNKKNELPLTMTERFDPSLVVVGEEWINNIINEPEDE
jgi:hypothetical protein